MALINPSGLYTGGKFNFNPQPYINIALQARARKQAREDAIDQYYQKLPDTLNDKGVRDQEIPIINEYKQKIFDYGQKNKEALRNPKLDNGASQHGLSQLFREASGIARNSQNAAKKDLEVGKMVLSKDGNWVADDEEFIEANRRHSLPVTDPDYKEYDMVQLMSNKPYDLNSHVKELKNNFKYGEDVTRVKDPNDPLYDVVISSPKLDEKTKQSLYAYSVEKLHNSKKFQKVLGSLEPDQLTMLNRLSEKTFGHPIREDFADEDLAAAYNVSILPVNAPTKEKSQVNTGAVLGRKEAFAKEMAGIRHKYGIEMEELRDRKIRARQKDGAVYNIDNVPATVRENSYTEPSVYGDFKVSDATKLSEGAMEDIFGKKGGKFGERPYKPIESNGKKLIKILPEGLEVRDADGNPVIIKDEDVIVNTNKRTVSLEKPVGTGKAKIRTNTPPERVGLLNDL